MQGIDLSPALDRGELTRDALLIEDDGNKVFLGFTAPPRLRTVVTGRYRLTAYLDEPWGELYDLSSDPAECSNLWDAPAHAALRADLLKTLANEMMRAVDRSPWPTRVA
jgi:arylsulfatase